MHPSPGSVQDLADAALCAIYGVQESVVVVGRWVLTVRRSQEGSGFVVVDLAAGKCGALTRRGPFVEPNLTPRLAGRSGR